MLVQVLVLVLVLVLALVLVLVLVPVLARRQALRHKRPRSNRRHWSLYGPRWRHARRVGSSRSYWITLLLLP